MVPTRDYYAQWNNLGLQVTSIKTTDELLGNILVWLSIFSNMSEIDYNRNGNILSPLRQIFLYYGKYICMLGYLKIIKLMLLKTVHFYYFAPN